MAWSERAGGVEKGPAALAEWASSTRDCRALREPISAPCRRPPGPVLSSRRNGVMNRRKPHVLFLVVTVISLNRPVLAAESPTPVSMSVQEFGRLAVADQRALLARVFQRRREHARNLYCEVDRLGRCYENRDGKPGNPLEKGDCLQFRLWQLRDSYRMDSNKYQSPDSREFLSWVSSGYNADEGIGRSTIRMNGRKRAFGRIDTTHDPITEGNRYRYWLDGEYPHKEDYLFRYLVDRTPEFEIKAPVEQDKVELTVSYQPWWAEKPGGQRVFLLDPQKGFLPIRGDSRWDAPPTFGRENWRVERFVVQESRLVADVWMPIKLREEILASPAPQSMAVYEMTVSRIEHGAVGLGDLVVPFPKGMEIVDAIQGVTYVADAQEKPAGAVEPVMGSTPSESLSVDRWAKWRYAATLTTVAALLVFFAWRSLRRPKRRAA